MATPALPQPVSKIIEIPGDVITVQLRPVPGVANDVDLHIQRNGHVESRFSLDELTQVLSLANKLLIQAKGRTLNAPTK